MQLVIKLTNWALTYENGVLSPRSKLWIKKERVKISLKNLRIYSVDDFFLNEELKNIVLNRFNNWIWVINSWLITDWLSTFDRGSMIKLISL